MPSSMLTYTWIDDRSKKPAGTSPLPPSQVLVAEGHKRHDAQYVWWCSHGWCFKCPVKILIRLHVHVDYVCSIHFPQGKCGSGW